MYIVDLEIANKYLSIYLPSSRQMLSNDPIVLLGREPGAGVTGEFGMFRASGHVTGDVSGK